MIVGGRIGGWFSGAMAVSSSAMVTVAVAGVPRMAPPLVVKKVTVKVSADSATVSFTMESTMFLGAASPPGQVTTLVVGG